MSGSDDGRVLVWNAESEDVETDVPGLGFSGAVTDVAWHPTDHMVAMCSYGARQPVLVCTHVRSEDMRATGGDRQSAAVRAAAGEHKRALHERLQAVISAVAAGEVIAGGGKSASSSLPPLSAGGGVSVSSAASVLMASAGGERVSVSKPPLTRGSSIAGTGVSGVSGGARSSVDASGDESGGESARRSGRRRVVRRSSRARLALEARAASDVESDA